MRGQSSKRIGGSGYLAANANHVLSEIKGEPRRQPLVVSAHTAVTEEKKNGSFNHFYKVHRKATNLLCLERKGFVTANV